MPLVRINKYLSANGVCSRREADRLISSGCVTINRRKAVLGDTVSDDDSVEVNREPVLERQEHVYFAYHKPVGVEVTHEKGVKRNLVEALGLHEHLFAIGRLDKDSSGLLLLTSNGDIVNRVLRPEFAHEKEYIVHTDRVLTVAELDQLEKPTTIDGHKTKPTYIERQNPRAFRILLTEGKNRQIRRMVEKIDAHVIALKRVRIMNIKLGHLKPGQWRPLTNQERKTFLSTLK